METVWIALTQLVLLHTVSASPANVALGKPASMSSRRDSRYSADTAVNGNTDANGYDGNQIIETDDGHLFAWWKVDLLRDVQDATVSIYFRTDYARRRNGVKLYTSTSPFTISNPTSQGQLCHTVTGRKDGSDISDVYNVTCLGTWRYLLLYTDTNNDGKGPVLDFGEVEVWACSNGTYGEDCTKDCTSRNCVTMTTICDRDGRCPYNCTIGWTATDCTQECEPNLYGSNCSLSCIDRKCVDSSTECDHVTGQCVDGCLTGYRGTDCRETCESVHYGSGCSLSCTDRKCLYSSSLCHHVTGQCIGGCQPGYKGTDCRQTCFSGVTYGVSCSKSCSSRHCVTSSTTPPACDPQIGLCPGGCESGWTGDDCSINIQHTLSMSTLIGAVVGASFTVFLICAGIYVCLIRKGRLHWKKSPDNKSSTSSTQMTNIARHHVSSSEHAHSTNQDHINDYDLLDSEKMHGNKNYDVIHHKEYQND